MKPWPGARGWLAATALLVTGLLLGTAARADTTTTWAATASNPPGGDGPVNAQAQITESSGKITVVLTNLEVNPTGAGQEISGILISFGSPLSSQTPSMASESGTLININSGGSYSVANGATITHWGASFSSSTDALCLASADGGPVSCGPSTSPYDLIIGPPGPKNLYSNANSSITGRNPQIQDAATFVLMMSGIQSTTQITGVQFQFGTPDFVISGHKVPGPVVGAGVPGLFAACGGLIAWLRRRRKTG